MCDFLENCQSDVLTVWFDEKIFMQVEIPHPNYWNAYTALEILWWLQLTFMKKDIKSVIPRPTALYLRNMPKHDSD